jgi:hypothetical protein
VGFLEELLDLVPLGDVIDEGPEEEIGEVEGVAAPQCLPLEHEVEGEVALYVEVLWPFFEVEDLYACDCEVVFHVELYLQFLDLFLEFLGYVYFTVLMSSTYWKIFLIFRLRMELRMRILKG